jgi:peptidoglycan/xylan/chitin deacetylase (PgdA/CDA1 family)
MRPRIRPYMRRAGRLGLIPYISRLVRTYAQSGSPSKHIKIDDEEQQLDDSQSSPWNASAASRRTMKLLLLGLLGILFLAIVIGYSIYKPPNFIIHYLQWKYPAVLFHVPLPASQRVLALTLDDAPSRGTAKILDLLKTYDAKATFFVIGAHADSYPELLQRIHDEGHEIGNHMWKDEPTISLPLDELRPQLAKVESLLPPNTGGAKYFRPGSGIFSSKMVAAAADAGYRTVLGSIFPFDPQIPSAWINSAHVLSMARPGGIIIMHENRPWSVDQLERVLKGLTAGGWKVENVGGLLQTAKEL